jgi:hypothetical protein
MNASGSFQILYNDAPNLILMKDLWRQSAPVLRQAKNETQNANASNNSSTQSNTPNESDTMESDKQTISVNVSSSGDGNVGEATRTTSLKSSIANFPTNSTGIFPSPSPLATPMEVLSSTTALTEPHFRVTGKRTGDQTYKSPQLAGSIGAGTSFSLHP